MSLSGAREHQTMHDEKGFDFNPRCKIPPSVGEAAGLASTQCCDRLSPAGVSSYQAAKITKSVLGDGCFDVTLKDGTRGTYVKSGGLRSLTPPPRKPSLGVSKATEVQETSEVGLMRPGGRHQLVDIHGLAVFLRQSTRCLSCRAACCLYVTGAICAQLATVTKVKITCQRCHYTASQTLSRPSVVPEDPGSPPNPTPPSETQSPHQPSSAPSPSLPNRSTPHPNPRKVLREEPTSLALLLNSKLKGSPSFLSPRGTTFSCGPSNKPLEEVWVKEEKEEEEALSQELIRSSHNDKKPTTDVQKMLSALDPLLCQPSQECSPSTSPSVLPQHQSKITSYIQDSMTAPSFSSHQCVTSSGSSVLGKPHGTLDSKETTEGESSFSQVPSSAFSMSMSSSVDDASTSSCVSSSPSICSDPTSSLLKLISNSVSSPLPFTLPLYSALFQQNPSPEPPPQLQTLEIEGKVVKGLEESLHLVKQIIKQGSASHPSEKEVEKMEHSSSRTNAEVRPKNTIISANNRVSENFDPAAISTNFSRRQKTSLANDLNLKNLSSRCKVKCLPEEKGNSSKDMCFLKELSTASKNRCTKKQSKKQSKLKGNVKKRFCKVGNEHEYRKEIKRLTEIDEEICHQAQKKNENDMTDLPGESPLLIRFHLGSKHNARNDKQKMDHLTNKQREFNLRRCTSFRTRQQFKQSSPDRCDLHKENLEACKTQINPSQDSSHVGPMPSWMKMGCLSNQDTCHCCSGSDHSTYMNCGCSVTFNCRKNLFMLQNIRKSLFKRSELYEQHLQTHSAEGTSGESGNVFDENTVDYESIQDDKIDLLSDDIDKLKKNINLMDKNSIRLAIKSLMKNNADRNPQRTLLKKPRISVSEDDTKRYRDTHSVKREDKDCCLQGDGSSMSWRFHDLLSSDSSSDSDMDSGDGRLIIDTDK